MHFRVMNVVFLNIFNFYTIFFYLLKAKPIRYCIELPV